MFHKFPKLFFFSKTSRGTQFNPLPAPPNILKIEIKGKTMKNRKQIWIKFRISNRVCFVHSKGTYIFYVPIKIEITSKGAKFKLFTGSVYLLQLLFHFNLIWYQPEDFQKFKKKPNRKVEKQKFKVKPKDNLEKKTDLWFNLVNKKKRSGKHVRFLCLLGLCLGAPCGVDFWV